MRTDPFATVRFDRNCVARAGWNAATALWKQGYANTKVEPGDASLYHFIAVANPGGVDRFMLASTYGPAYPIPRAQLDPGYVAEKWLDRRYRNDHTTAVYTSFINALIGRLREIEDDIVDAEILDAEILDEEVES